MDLIYTNAKRVDQGVLTAYAFDLSFGADENDFEMTIATDEAVIESDAYIYMEGTEYGGRIDGLKATTKGETITYMGRTWHGIINSKIIQPDSGEDYFVVSGDANAVLSTLIDRLGLSGLFVADETDSGITISTHQFNRYCAAYDGIRAMLEKHNAKLQIVWKDRAVHLSAVPIVDYTKDPVDGDTATLKVEQYTQKVNHLICLGKGDLAEREVIHLYADQFGRIGDVQYYTGLDEIVETYENTSAASSEDLRNYGVTEFTKRRSVDKAEATMPESESNYDIGDIVGAHESKSGISVSAAVTQKIVKIQNGAVSTNYKTGG